MQKCEHLKMSTSDSGCCCWPHPSCSLNHDLQTVLGASCATAHKPAKRQPAACLTAPLHKEAIDTRGGANKSVASPWYLPAPRSKETSFFHAAFVRHSKCESHNARFIMYLTEIYLGFKKWRKCKARVSALWSNEPWILSLTIAVMQRWQWSK